MVACFLPACLLIPNLPGCDAYRDTSEPVDMAVPPGTRTDGALVFYIDGVNAEVFEQMLAAGELPAIKRHLADRGLYAPRAVANLPSVTLVNKTSFVTSLYPGHHGVTGADWFDRTALIYRDYETLSQMNALDGDYRAPTVWERMGDRTTLSVFFWARRGVTDFEMNWAGAAGTLALLDYEWFDRLIIDEADELADAAVARGRVPALTILYQLAVDMRGYENGSSSPRYHEALRHADRQVGRVLDGLQAAGLRDRFYIALTADHGMVDVRDHFLVIPFLEKFGLDVVETRLSESTSLADRQAYFDRHRAVAFGSGEKYAALCLRRPIRNAAGRVTGWHPWTERPAVDDLRGYPANGGQVDLVALTLGAEAIEMVAYPMGPNHVRVRMAGGAVDFVQPAGRGGDIAAAVAEGEDPLGWADTVDADLLSGQPASPQHWLRGTIDSPWPDMPAQLLAYFRAARAGDLVLFAADGWDFSNVHHGGHGGPGRGDMNVPLLLAGPGIKPGRLRVARTIDVAPTLMTLLGYPAPADTDGRPLLDVPTIPRPE